MNFIKKNITIILVIFLALVLRFWSLDSYPAFNADEAAIGYNAYSLLETGKDEHGNSWPVHFQSFNDYKPGLYFYLAVPFVKVLGLNEWAVRIPGAGLGVLTVLILYFIGKELFQDQYKFRAGAFEFTFGEIAALMLAISPWHIHFSRGGWEVNTATFFISAGFLFFLKGLKNTNKLIISTLFFVASMYTYHAARIIVPLLIVGGLFIYRDYIKNNLKPFIVSALTAFVFLIPLLLDFTRGGAISRAAGVGLFADPGPLNRINEQRGEHNDFTNLGAKLLHNKAVNYGLAFVKNWADHFHGEFLFLSGDGIQRNKVPETGQMYFLDILFIAIGLVATARLSKLPSGIKVVLWWLIIAPTAAALTFQSPHALRAHNMIIPLTIVSAYGLVNLVGWLQMKNLKLGVWLLVGLLVWQFTRYEHMYWGHMTKEYPFSSQYGVKELVGFIKEGGEKYQKIVITDRYDQPYILFLFYLKYSPEKFQLEHQLTPRDQFGFSTVRDFGKYTFVSVSNWNDIRVKYPNSLIGGTDEEIPEEANIMKEIYGTNGYKYFQVVAN